MGFINNLVYCSFSVWLWILLVSSRSSWYVMQATFCIKFYKSTLSNLAFWNYSIYLFHLEINIFWATHQVHHSSEDYNLSTAIRQSMFQNLISWVRNFIARRNFIMKSSFNNSCKSKSYNVFSFKAILSADGIFRSTSNNAGAFPIQSYFPILDPYRGHKKHWAIGVHLQYSVTP